VCDIGTGRKLSDDDEGGLEGVADHRSKKVAVLDNEKDAGGSVMLGKGEGKGRKATAAVVVTSRARVGGEARDMEEVRGGIPLVTEAEWSSPLITRRRRVNDDDDDDVIDLTAERSLQKTLGINRRWDFLVLVLSFQRSGSWTNVFFFFLVILLNCRLPGEISEVLTPFAAPRVVRRSPNSSVCDFLFFIFYFLLVLINILPLPVYANWPLLWSQERRRDQLVSDEALARQLENEESPVRPGGHKRKHAVARRRAATPDEELAMKIYEDDVGFDSFFLLLSKP